MMYALCVRERESHDNINIKVAIAIPTSRLLWLTNSSIPTTFVSSQPVKSSPTECRRATHTNVGGEGAGEDAAVNAKCRHRDVLPSDDAKVIRGARITIPA